MTCAGTLARTLDRLEDYRELTRDFGESLEAAAARMGVSTRTAERYERRLRERHEGHPNQYTTRRAA